jgi:ABC-type (unclassified) transport system, ATPase component
MLRAHGLAKRYKQREVVRSFELQLDAGEVVGLLGPNGAGKTTCFYMIVGLVAADAGRIELDGRDITNEPMYERAKLGVGYLPQEPSVFRKLSVADNIALVLELRRTWTRPAGAMNWARCWKNCRSPMSPTSSAPACPAVNGAGSKSPARWRPSRA